MGFKGDIVVTEMTDENMKSCLRDMWDRLCATEGFSCIVPVWEAHVGPVSLSVRHAGGYLHQIMSTCFDSLQD